MRKFYCVKTNNEEYYRDQIILSNVSCIIDWRFLKYREDEGSPVLEANGSHQLFVVEKCNEFEKNLHDNNIPFVILPITEKEYDYAYSRMFKCTETLHEKLEYGKDGYKIIIRSDEDTNHLRPHVHVEVDGGDSSASISIDDEISILAISGKAKEKDYKKAISCIKANLQHLRKEWNEFSHSKYKFKVVNEDYIC